MNDKSTLNELRLLYADVSVICDSMEKQLERARLMGGDESGKKATETEIQLLSAYRLKLDTLLALNAI